MRKITHLFILLILSWNSLFGQIENYYSVSEETITYAPLVGGDETVLSPFTRYNERIPFDFEYAGKQLGNLLFFNRGYMVLSGGSVTPQPNDISDIGQQNFGATSILAPLWDNSLSVPSGNTNSKRKTLLSGVAPNRTYTVEWENVLWGTTGSEVSFRIIFEETTNNITFHYGSNLSTEDVSASIGMNTEFSDTLSFLSVTPGAAPLASSTVGNNSVSAIDYPSEGTSYVFAYTPPTCLIPAFLSIENSTLTPESVEVKWVSSDSETAWEILLKDLSGGTSEVVSVNSNPFLLDNLNENSDYSIAIRAVCSALDSSEYSAQTFFTTPAICPKPLSLNETAIDLTTASFTWEAGDAETLWEVAIALLGDPEPSSGLELNITNYDATGLIKDTDYVLYVRANCGSTDGLSEWSALNFRTAATCIAPSNVIISNETCNTADVDWTSNGSETLWEVLVESFNGDQVITNTTEKPFTITNLIAGRTVRVFISAICSPTDKSRQSQRTFASALPDNSNPVVIVRDITLELDASGNGTIEPSDIDDGSSDDCAIASMTLSKSAFDCLDLGENSVFLNVSDSNGGTASAQSIVTIVDVIDPIASVQNITLELDSATGNASILPTAIDNGSSDNCSIASMTLSKSSFDCTNLGENSVTFTVVDTSGRSASVDAIVTVIDLYKPIVFVLDINLELDETGSATIEPSDIDDDSDDNCSIASMSLSKSTFDCSNLGENSVILTVVDTSGNSASTNSIVTVVDTIKPDAFCLPPFEVQLDDSGFVAITLADINNNSSDNCEIQFIDIDKSLFDINDIGENIVTLMVEDSNPDNITSCTTIVTVLEADPSFVIEDYVTNLDTPIGLDFDDSGILYVAEYTSGNVLKVTALETYTQFANTGFRNNNIVFNSEGSLLTTDDFFSQIFEINNTGTTNLYTSLPSNASPYGIAFNSVGDLFVSFTTQGKIVKIAQDLTITDYAIGFFQPEGIVFDSNDNLYVADRSDRKLFKIDDQGNRTVVASNVPTIRAVAVDSEDNIYYNNSPSNPSLPMQVMKYDPVSNTSSVLAEKQNQGSSTLLVNELEFDNVGNLFIAYENQVGIIRNVDSGTLSIEDVFVKNRLLINTVIDNNELRFTENVKSIEVYNLSGASVYSSNEADNKFTLPTLNTGIYILKIKDFNNSILIEKIIEQ